DVGESFDVGVRMHRPVGTRDQPVVVENPERADAHLIGVAVPVEREVPAGPEPASILGVDLGVASDLQQVAPRSTSGDSLQPYGVLIRYAESQASRFRVMTDWRTIASLATAGGTLVLALATFAAVRSSNRSSRGRAAL